MPTTRRALSENEDMDASQPLKRSSDAAAAALFEDLPSPAADPASADPCPRTLAFARAELEARGESHGLAHARRVRALALAIYAELGGDDARVVEVAALLHDVCDHKYVDPATDAGRACIERRDRFLAETLSASESAAVVQIMGAVSYSREAKALKKGEAPAWAALPESIRVLRHCVSDADKIDAIGVRGLERCAQYARERGVRGPSAVAREVAEHCDEKLLRLRDEYVRTAPGKRRAAPGCSSAIPVKMGKYSFDPDQAVESSKARGSALRAHFKHCREVCHNIKGMKLPKAKAYLEDVLQFKQAVAFTKFTGGCGRHAQGKLRNAAGSKCRWPQKATKIVLDLLKNAEANAEMKGLDVDELIVKHSQANRAPYQRRRTYRAHGRINPYMASPAHIELVLVKAAEPVAKGESAPVKLSRKQAARLRVTAGGGTA